MKAEINKAYIVVQLIALYIFSPQSIAESQDTYTSCLKDALKGSHNFTATDVRSLCEEISGTEEPTYKWTEKKMIPDNEFTKCYDKEKVELKALGEKKADKVAKIVCRYETR